AATGSSMATLYPMQVAACEPTVGNTVARVETHIRMSLLRTGAGGDARGGRHWHVACPTRRGPQAARSVHTYQGTVVPAGDKSGSRMGKDGGFCPEKAFSSADAMGFKSPPRIDSSHRPRATFRIDRTRSRRFGPGLRVVSAET